MAAQGHQGGFKDPLTAALEESEWAAPAALEAAGASDGPAQGANRQAADGSEEMENGGGSAAVECSPVWSPEVLQTRRPTRCGGSAVAMTAFLHRRPLRGDEVCIQTSHFNVRLYFSFIPGALFPFSLGFAANHICQTRRIRFYIDSFRTPPSVGRTVRATSSI